MRALLIGLTLTTLLLSGCANVPTAKYDWGSYDLAMYDFYTNPAHADEFAAKLQASIANAESQGKVVPPGVYAEYGYVLLEAGKNQEAIGYFTKESQHWPESRYFMHHMIQLATGSRDTAKGAS